MTMPETLTCQSKNLMVCDGPVVAPSRPYKIRMTIVMIVFVYPIVTLLLYALTPITVSLIVFVVSPLIARRFDWFLRPRSAP